MKSETSAGKPDRAADGIGTKVDEGELVVSTGFATTIAADGIGTKVDEGELVVSTGFATTIAADGIGSKVDEGELVALLAALRVEAAPEADFEARFLYDLRERIAREVVCCPARTLLWEHIIQFLTNLGRRRRLAFGATACGAFACCSAYLAWPSDGDADTRAETALTNRFESTLSALKPGAAKDVTRISVGKPSSVRTMGASPTGLRTSALFAEADETYETSPYTRANRQETISVPHSGASHGLPDIGF